jgi:hypothetical protein
VFTLILRLIANIEYKIKGDLKDKYAPFFEKEKNKAILKLMNLDSYFSAFTGLSEFQQKDISKFIVSFFS